MASDKNEDYVWNFAVHPSPERFEDPLVEMARLLLDDFLGIGFLTQEGNRVCVDGFAFSNSPDKIYTISRDKVTPGADHDGKP